MKGNIFGVFFQNNSNRLPAEVFVPNNKTRTSKVFGKKLEISDFFFFQKMSHRAVKCKRGTLWSLLTYILLQNIKKLERGTLWDIKNFSKKSRTVPKKIKRGDPSVSAGFVGYDKNGLTERGDPLYYLKCAASILVVL